VCFVCFNFCDRLYFGNSPNVPWRFRPLNSSKRCFTKSRGPRCSLVLLLLRVFAHCWSGRKTSTRDKIFFRSWANQQRCAEFCKCEDYTREPTSVNYAQPCINYLLAWYRLLEKVTDDSACQEISRILWNPKIHWSVYTRDEQCCITMSVSTDSKNMNFLICVTNASVWTPVLRLWVVKSNTKLASFAMELVTWTTVGRGWHLHMEDNKRMNLRKYDLLPASITEERAVELTF